MRPPARSRASTNTRWNALHRLGVSVPAGPPPPHHAAQTFSPVTLIPTMRLPPWLFALASAIPSCGDRARSPS